MGKDSKIEWTHHTFNPWIGCEKVSPACLNCYAEELNKRFRWVEWGAGKPRREANPAVWAKALRWNKAALDAGRRDRVFCASLADVLDPSVPKEWLHDVLQLVQGTKSLDWLLLTKREQELQRIPAVIQEVLGVKGGMLPNLWVGVTAENNEFWKRRVPLLMEVLAVVRFVSVEPLLGPITMGDGPAPDWIIAGGESGPRARPMNPAWLRGLRDDAKERGVAFLFKQWGGVDKAAAGRLLDGELLDGYPVPRQIPVTVE